MTTVHPAFDRGLLRARRGQAHHRVSFVELFFDLVFVFAVTQLSHLLIEHFSIMGAVETALLMFAVWWVWMYTTWFTNWIDPEKPPVRLAMLAMMVAGLIMSASIPKAFESRGLAFAGAYASIQVGRTAFFLWAVRGHELMTRNVERILAWLMFTAVFWIAGGLAYGGERLALWTLAIALDFVAPSLGYWVPGLGRSVTADWEVEGGHIAERCALFIIIALGESVLVTGATFSGLTWDAPTVAGFVASFVGSLAMWWLYFDVGAELGSETISRSADPGRLARLTYTYIHLVLVAGIIVAAAADEFVLAHPVGHAETRVAVTVLGGVALYLFGHALFAWSIAGRVPVPSVSGLAVVVALAPAATHVSPVALMTIGTMVLTGVAMGESMLRRRSRLPKAD